MPGRREADAEDLGKSNAKGIMDNNPVRATKALSDQSFFYF
jgi:hypothetical protein